MKYILWFAMVMVGIICNANNGFIEKDGEGFVWILKNDTLNRYDGKHLKPYMTEWKSTSLFSDSRKRTWIATAEGGLYCHDLVSDRFEMAEGIGIPTRIYALDRNDNFWMENQGDLCIYNPNTERLFRFRQNYGKISGVSQLSSHTYFVATSSGLYIFRLYDGKLTCLSKELSDGRCTHITQLCFHAESRKLFVKDERTGLYVFECETNQFKKVDTGIFPSSVACLCSFDADNVLVATDNAVMYRLDVDSYSCGVYADMNLYVSGGRHKHDVKEIWVDGKKRIWLVDYVMGIMVMEKVPLQCVSIRNRRGGDRQEVSGCSLYRVYRIHCQGCHPEDVTYIAFLRGTSLVWHAHDTVRAFAEPYAPVYLDELVIHNRKMDSGKKNSFLKRTIRHVDVLDLAYSENCFTIKAVSPDFEHPSGIMYTWKLDNSQWAEPSAEGNITYTDLRPGKYRLCIRTISAGTGRPVGERNVRIIVRRPFWKTSGIYVVYGLLSVFLGVGLMKRIFWKPGMNAVRSLAGYAGEARREDGKMTVNLQDMEFMEKIDRYIEENLSSSRINIGHIADNMNMSRTSFYNKMKMLTRQAPQEYIHKYKMEKAARLLLLRKDIRISEVADLMGFTDLKYFRLVFKKYYGMSPSEYRNRK